MARMRAMDRSFDPARFLDGAEKAFGMIVGAFAEIVGAVVDQSGRAVPRAHVRVIDESGAEIVTVGGVA